MNRCPHAKSSSSTQSKKQGYVYIVTFSENQNIYKVGYTTNPDKRIPRLKYEYRHLGTPICKAIAYGSNKDESAIQEYLGMVGHRYEACRVSTELFHASDVMCVLVEQFKESEDAREALAYVKMYMEECVLGGWI